MSRAPAPAGYEPSAIIREERIGGQRLLLGDCLDIMPTLGRFGACVTDPPYWIGALMVGGTWAVTSGYHAMQKWDAEAPQEAVEMAVSLADQSIVWGGNHFILPSSRRWLIWNKIGSAPKMADAEMAWTSMDAPTRLVSMHAGNGATGKERRQHPTQKPLALMEWCLGFVPSAKTILDPFAGSGTTAVACERMGRQCTAIEIDPDYFEVICRRVDEATRQKDLFATTPEQPKQEAMEL